MAELYNASDEALDDQAAAIKAAHVHLRELGNSIALIAAAAHRAGRGQTVQSLTSDAVVEAAAREAFHTDDFGGHLKPGPIPHTWENIPEEGRENYRTLVRAVLTVAPRLRRGGDVMAVPKTPGQGYLAEPMTPQRLAEIREREQAAALTPTPWMTFGGRTIAGPSEGCNCAAPFDGFQGHEPYCGMEPIADAGRKADAEFIAHARQDVPALLAEIERMDELARSAIRAEANAVRELEADLARERQRIDAALAEHPEPEQFPVSEDWPRSLYCAHCGKTWPCPTRRALTGDGGDTP